MPRTAVCPLHKEPSTVRFAPPVTGPSADSRPRMAHRYRPELHRQATEGVPLSRVGEELRRLVARGLGEALDAEAEATARQQATNLLGKLHLSLKRNRYGLEIVDPVPLQCFAHWHVTPDTTVVCLLPVSFSGLKVIQTDAGHVVLKLPPIVKPEVSLQGHRQAPPADMRTKDGVHVSPRRLHSALAKMVTNCLLKLAFTKDRIRVSQSGDDLSLLVKLDCGWTADLVPCVAASTSPADDEVYYVTRRFIGEGYDTQTDTWQPCWAVRDRDLLRSISCWDRGSRLRALHLVTRLLSRDWRLAFFTCYHVQTALLHDMDFHVDFSPRWQRYSLESCVTCLLKTLTHFVDRESLPHFNLNRLNLWHHVTSRQMAQARGALRRLLSNEKALVSLIKRASTETCTGLGP